MPHDDFAATYLTTPLELALGAKLVDRRFKSAGGEPESWCESLGMKLAGPDDLREQFKIYKTGHGDRQDTERQNR